MFFSSNCVLTTILEKYKSNSKNTLVLIFFTDESNLAFQCNFGFLTDECFQAVFQNFWNSLLYEVSDGFAVFVVVQQHRKTVDFGFHEFQRDFLLSARFGGHNDGLNVARDK